MSEIIIVLLTIVVFIWVVWYWVNEYRQNKRNKEMLIAQAKKRENEKRYICANCLTYHNNPNGCPTGICKDNNDKQFLKRHGKTKEQYWLKRYGYE